MSSFLVWVAVVIRVFAVDNPRRALAEVAVLFGQDVFGHEGAGRLQED